MNHVLYPLCALISVLALLFKLRILRTDRSPTQIALLANFFFLSVTFTISTPTVWVAVSAQAGIVNLSGLLSQSTVILSAASQQLVLLHLSHDRRTAWRKATPRLVALATILATMVVLFSAATSHQENPDDFAVNHAQYYPLYLGVYLLGYTVNQVDVGILGWRYSKIAPTPWLRRGLVMIAVTMPFAMIYALCRVADIIAGRLGSSGHAWEPIAQVSVSLAVIAKTIGWTLPDWGRHLSRLWLRIQHEIALRQLKPLHEEVTRQTDCMILDLGPRADVRTRLYRLLVEIRDAQWVLRKSMHPCVAVYAEKKAREAGLEGTTLSATIEAAQLKAALQARAVGLKPHTAPSPLAAEPQELAAEIDFQRRLAHAFRRSPVVREVAAISSSRRPRTKERA
ncbi:MAB_1171c family putative transporter [Streptomyces sp. NPDC095613]|uniref:MAB_1171c family putative transporter n=1 Tax=Streptomyces sp. NPDC095613 TaxID=3155540 RepID=UPI00332D1597